MNSRFKMFYRDFYLRTGFIPTKPLNLNINPGDFFQIRNGQIVILGNIYRSGIADADVDCIEKAIISNPHNWSFSNGVSRPFSGYESGTLPIDPQYESRKQVLSFNESGSYFFRGNNPKTIKIVNWEAIKESLIIKFTQVLHSFREVYVATECTTASDWTLAIAGSKEAELEIGTNEFDNFVDFFGLSSTFTIRSKDIEYYNREPQGRSIFFKAYRLQVKSDKKEAFVSEFIRSRAEDSEWASSFFDYDFKCDTMEYSPLTSNYNQINHLDMLQANQLNPNTALSYFRWEQAGLQDLEKLFMTYAE